MHEHKTTNEHIVEHIMRFIQAQDEVFGGESTQKEMMVATSAYITALTEFAELPMEDAKEIVNEIQKLAEEKYPQKFSAIKSPFQ